MEKYRAEGPLATLSSVLSFLLAQGPMTRSRTSGRQAPSPPKRSDAQQSSSEGPQDSDEIPRNKSMSLSEGLVKMGNDAVKPFSTVAVLFRSCIPLCKERSPKA